MSACTIQDCDLKHYGRGWCKNHYMRFYRHGNTDSLWDTQHVQDKGACVSDGCGRVWRYNKWKLCDKHYSAMRRPERVPSSRVSVWTVMSLDQPMEYGGTLQDYVWQDDAGVARLYHPHKRRTTEKDTG